MAEQGELNNAIGELSRRVSDRATEFYKLACRRIGIGKCVVDESRSFVELFDLVVEGLDQNEAILFTCGVLNVAGVNNHPLRALGNAIGFSEYNVRKKYQRVDLQLTIYKLFCDVDKRDFAIMRSCICSHLHLSPDQFHSRFLLAEAYIDEGLITDVSNVSKLREIASTFNRQWIIDEYSKRHDPSMTDLKFPIEEQSTKETSGHKTSGEQVEKDGVKNQSAVTKDSNDVTQVKTETEETTQTSTVGLYSTEPLQPENCFDKPMLVAGGGIPPTEKINFKKVLAKEPEFDDLFSLLKRTTLSVDSLARELGLNDTTRKKVMKDEECKLETMLKEWIQQQSKPVTWKTVIDALVELERKDIAKNICEFLEDQNNFMKYKEKKDFIALQY